jgi:hypothetical protein
MRTAFENCYTPFIRNCHLTSVAFLKFELKNIAQGEIFAFITDDYISFYRTADAASATRR